METQRVEKEGDLECQLEVDQQGGKRDRQKRSMDRYEQRQIGEREKERVDR